ncbi:two pore potassium channel protein sup-9-like [Liolophura sinensis]|uniref:two pore potassium channel protein sup-9-like n=1 Tax=Liolophura sinensis TaxID=3198878 RepID=UPI003158D196
MVIGYSLLGGWLFSALEVGEEIRQKSVIGKIRSKHIDELWDATERLNVFHKSAWMRAAEDSFIAFQTEIYSAVREDGWDGTESGDDIQWTFTGALLYSVTTITTIGYGHITPKTAWGRAATIFYALIGIPLTLLCLSNIGESLGKCFKFLYGRIICGLCRGYKRQHLRKVSSIQKKPVKKSQGCGCCRGDNPEVPETEARGFTSDKPEARDFTSDKPEAEMEVFTTDAEAPSVKPPSPVKETTRVPVIVTIAIMVGYVLLGSLLFTLWEEDWDFLTGSYFCFITLSTIGFGDVVPGSSLQSWSSQEKQVLCALYLLFGLALLAMSFDLMQEQVRHTCRRVGLCLRIIREKEP